jgi:colicin import membrane protein
MNRSLAILAVAMAAAAAHAQSPEDAAERERIAGERAVAEGRYVEAQKVCRGKFAVNDCLEKARREHNDVVSGLKRQERVLNDAERKRRAAERQKEIDERSSPERQKEAAEKRAKSVAEQQERDARASEKAAKRAADDAERQKHGPRVKEPKGASGPQGSPREPMEAKSHGPTAEEAAKNRAEHQARLEEAERHKAAIEERNAKRSKPASAELPPPPR